MPIWHSLLGSCMHVWCVKLSMSGLIGYTALPRHVLLVLGIAKHYSHELLVFLVFVAVGQGSLFVLLSTAHVCMYTVCCDVCACLCVCTVSSTLIKYQPVTHPNYEGVGLACTRSI